MKKIAASILVIFTLVFPFNSTAFAVGSAGFENASFSAASVASGNATVAQADEPAAISYNPAGLTELRGIQIQNNVGLLHLSTRHSANGGVDYSTSTIHAIPTGYLTVNPGDKLSNRFAFGIGTDIPFGLSNKYDSNLSQVHYAGWNNYLKMFAIKPTLAVKLAKWLSIGASPVFYRVFKFGGIQAYPNRALGGPFANAPDGQVRLNLTGHTWGWQMGMLAKVHPKHQFGFYFRSPVTIFTHGEVKVEDALAAVGPRNFETGANAKLDLPLNFTWAYAFKPNEKDTLEVDLGYTRWSAHERLYFTADNVNAANDGILNSIGKADKDYDDSWSIHFGGKHKFNKKFSIRYGSFFYTFAVPGDHFIPAVPDGNRLGFSTGFSYQITERTNFDFGVVDILSLRRNINNNISETLGTSVDGKYFSNLVEVAFSLTYAFDGPFAPKENKK